MRLTRRHALHVAGVAAIGSLLPACATRSEADTLTIIDTHTHFYDPGRPQGVPWPDKTDEVLYRTVMPKEFHALTAPLGVSGTVVVEASPWAEDNDWILSLTDSDPRLMGFVGRLDPDDAKYTERLRSYSRHRKFRGLRLQGDTIAKRVGDPGFVRAVSRLADFDLSLDVLGNTTHMAAVAVLGSAIPTLRIVLDHCAGVVIDGKVPPSTWVDAMKACAALPNIACKVSGLVEYTGRVGAAPADVAFYRPVLDTLWTVFGSERVLYGSNWPVCTRFADYAQVQKIVQTYVSGRPLAEQRMYFAGNALRIYKP